MTDLLEIRLWQLFVHLKVSLAKLDPDERYVCIEGVGKGRTHHHAQLAAGVLRAVCYDNCARLFSLTPFEVRYRLGLPARASKEQVWGKAFGAQRRGHYDWDEHTQDAYALAVVGAMCIKEAR